MKSVATCIHCGTLCNAVSVDLDGQPFCCLGCRTVYQILHRAGLERYYSIEDTPGARPSAPPVPGKYHVLDEPGTRRKILNFSDGKTAHVTFHLPAIHCAACIWLLERLHQLQAGVGNSEVNFPRQELSVTFYENDITLSELAASLEQLGYPPQLRLSSADDVANSSGGTHMAIPIGVAGFCFGNVMLLSLPMYLGLSINSYYGQVFAWLSFALCLPALAFGARGYAQSAWTGLKQRRLSIDVPIVLGMTALFFHSLYNLLSGTGEGYFDSLTALIFFLLLGKWFVQRSHEALQFDRDYRAYFPLSATRLESGTERSVSVSDLKPGDRLLIRNGELIPCDGVLRSPLAQIDYSFVTGESEPVEISEGKILFAGGRHTGPVIELDVEKETSQSYLTSLWNNPDFRKETDQSVFTLTDRVARWFTLGLLLIATLTALYWWPTDPGQAIRSFAAILIVACPCALALSAPLTFGSFLRIFGRHKFYLKNGHVIEQIARTEQVMFDKTGTLTRRQPTLGSWEGPVLFEEETRMVKTLTHQSSHPISQAIYEQLQGEDDAAIEDLEEIPGQGLSATICEQTVELRKSRSQEAAVELFIDDTSRGHFTFVQELRPGISELLQRMAEPFQLSILSGDSTSRVQALAEQTGIDIPFDGAFAPGDKQQAVQHKQQAGGTVMMLGDGLNDAGALMQSDVGIAVTDSIHAFSPACDAILDANALPKLDAFITASHRAMKVVGLSITLSLLYNLIGIAWAASGHLSPLVAAILMPLSSLTILATALGGTYLSTKNLRETTA